ncbi:hypothetical protein [Tepidibacillus marianensis]
MISYLIAAVILIYSGWILRKVLKKRLNGDCCSQKIAKIEERKEGRS